MKFYCQHCGKPAAGLAGTVVMIDGNKAIVHDRCAKYLAPCVRHSKDGKGFDTGCSSCAREE